MEVETTSEALLGGGGEDAELTVVKAAVDGTDVERGAEVTDGVEVAMEDDVSAEGAPARGATTTPAVRVRRPIPAWPLVYYRVQPDNTAEGDVLWPIFRYERQGDDESYRVRPLIYSRNTHLGSGDRETDVLWPLFHTSRTHNGVDGGHTARFDIRPWLWSLARRYGAAGDLLSTEASALFCLVRYRADGESLDFAIHPWLVRYLREIEEDDEEDKEPQQEEDREERPYEWFEEYYADEDYEQYEPTYRLLAEAAAIPENDYSMMDTTDEVAAEEVVASSAVDEAAAAEEVVASSAVDDRDHAATTEARRPTRVSLKILGGLVEYLKTSTRLHFAVRPKLFGYDHDAATGEGGTLEVSALAGLAKYSVGPWGEGRAGVTRTNTRLAPLFFRQSATGGDNVQGLPEYTVVFPLYFHVRGENTSRLHVWPVFGIQTFDGARVVEYSTLYPFFRLTTFSHEIEPDHQQDKEFRIDLWPLVHYQQGPGRNLSHKVFPFYAYAAAVEPSGPAGLAQAAYHTQGHFLFYYWDSSYALPAAPERSSSSSLSSSSSSSSTTPSLGSASEEEPFLPTAESADEGTLQPPPSFRHSWGLFPVCQRTLSDSNESLYLFPLINSESSFQFFEEETLEEVEELIEIDTTDSESEDDSENESDSESDSQSDDTSDSESDEPEDSDEEMSARPRKGKGKGKGKAKERRQSEQKQKKKRKRVTMRKAMAQRTRRVKKEIKSAFVPLLMAYYTRDDMAQRSALYSPLVCCATQGAGGDGWLLLPLYYSRREQGGAAAGGSETRAVLPVYYWRQDNNSRALAVLPFYADRTNFITNSRFQMRTPAWFKYHNGVTGADHWWGFIPFPFYKHDSNNLYAFMLFPFYGVIRDLANNSMPGTVAEAFTPFFYRFNVCPNDPNLAARSRLNFFLPLCAGTWENHTDRGRFAFLLPLLTFAFSMRKKQELMDMDVVLVLPLLNCWVSVRSPTERIKALFPFYLNYRNNTHHRVFVLPCFYYSCDLRYNERRLVLTPFIVDDNHMVSRGSRTQWVFPLYFYAYQESAGRTVFLCPLALYGSSRDTGASFLLTPLLMDRFLPTDGTRHQWLLPVLFRRLWADNEEVLLLPVYYHRHLVDQATGAVHDTTAVVPFYMGTTHVAGDGTLTYARHMLFFPVFRRAYAPGEGAIAYDVLWPLAHYSRTPTSRNVRLLPLAWIYDDSAARGSSRQVSRARVFFPLFYSLDMGDGRKLTAFFPFWLKHQGADGGSVTVGTFGLLPPYFYRRVDEHNQTKSLHVWPLLGYHRDGNKWGCRLLWPLFTFDTDADRGSVYTRFLLFLHTSQRSQPIAGSAQLAGRRSFTSLLPLWFHQSNTDADVGVRDFSLLAHYYQATSKKLELALGWLLHPALSVFYYKRTDDTLLHRLLAVYHYTWSRAGLSRLSLLWLFHPSAALILLSKDPDHTLAYIFAVFHYMRDKATGNFRLSFLWALHPALAVAAVTRELGRLRHHAFPFYHYSNDSNTNTVSLSFLYLLFPALALGQWRRCADTLRHYLMPLYFYKHDRARATRQLSFLWLLAPQLALARWTASNTETRARVTGLWHYVRNQRSVQWSLLYPLVFPAALALIRYTRESDGPTVHYAAPLYYYRNEHHRRLFALFYLLHPALSLFHYSRREFGQHTHRSVEVAHRLTPLYRYARTQDQSGRATSVEFSLGSLLSWLSLFSYRRQEGTVSHGVPLLYNYSSSAFETRLSFLCGLFSHVSQAGHTNHRVWPFYSYSNDAATGVLRFTAVCGLFLYLRSKAQLLVRLWPLFRSERKEADPAQATPASSQLSLLWAFHPALSIYRYFTDGSKTFSRMWPFYHYEDDKAQQKKRLCVAYVAPGVSLLRHQKVGTSVENWVWPLVRATSSGPKQPRCVDALWLLSKPRVSLLQFERDRNKLELWPLFSYATDPASQAKRLRLLVTVVQYQSTATSYDLKVLWRMMRVARESDGSYSACVNPLIYHEHSPTAGSWTAFLGGLIAREVTPAGQSRMSYFWLF